MTLAFLLVTAGLGLSAGTGGTGDYAILVQGVGDAAVDDAKVEILGLATQDSVGVVDVGARQVRDCGVQLRKANEDLFGGVSYGGL